MEERTGWRDAFSTAWGNLTGLTNEGNVRIIRLGFFAIFLLGTAWAAWSYLQGLVLLELEESYAFPAPNQAQADKRRLDAMIEDVERTSRLRAGSPEAVRIMVDNLGKYPFAEPRFEDLFTLDDIIPVEVPVVVIDYPPAVVLRGIMIMGNQHVAVMDIPGVGTGMIVKVGDTFMQRRGRIVRIASDKVVVNWGGRNWDIAPSF